MIFSISNLYPQSRACEKLGVFLPYMPACNNGNYYLVFEDSFDGNSLDLSKWKMCASPEGALATDVIQGYHTLANVEVSNGTLKIIAKKETVLRKAVSWLPDNEILNDGLPNLRYYYYTTSSIGTHQNFYYGKYEIRCRVPDGKGFWPAFWTFGGPGWNEIDFFEIYGDNIRRYTCNTHCDFGETGVPTGRYQCPFAQSNVVDFSQWHVFTCLFDWDKITWQIDGSTVRVFHRFSTVSGYPISCGENIGVGTYFMEKSYPEQSMNIIMNLAIQSGSDAPDGNTIFPNTYEIDYVRYYIKSEQPPDCLAHIVYQNTNQLPTLTQASGSIQAGNNVIVQSGQDVTFKAPTIRLLPGFKAESGSTFRAIPEGCTFQNSRNDPIDFMEIREIDTFQVKKSSQSDQPNFDQEITIGEEFEKTISNTFDKEFILYPNPTNDKLNVYYSANNNSYVFFIITDMNGRDLFREQKQNNIGANEKIIDVSRFSNGAYILRIISNDEMLENLFIISK